jgi:probable rRNA maturation factor
MIDTSQTPASLGLAAQDPTVDGDLPELGSGGAPPWRCELQLQNPNRYPESGARRLRPWLAPLLDALAPGAQSFVARFVSDREMRRLNREYRGKDDTTDVLSFEGDYRPAEEALAAPASTSTGPSMPRLDHLGDVVISLPTARRQAAEAGHSVEREVQELLLHGVLHCLGHDHETDDGTMERLERRLRRRFIDHV